jgi:hypothetical protein
MTKDESETLIRTIRQLTTDLERTEPLKGAKRLGPIEEPTYVREAVPERGERLTAVDLEAVYRYVKKRLIDDMAIDPILLQLMTSRPELEILVEPRRVSLDGSTLRGRVAKLLGNGFLKEPRKLYAIRQELARTGTDPGGGGNLSTTVSDLVKDGFLLREGEGFMLAPGVKVSTRDVEVVT